MPQAQAPARKPEGATTPPGISWYLVIDVGAGFTPAPCIWGRGKTRPPLSTCSLPPNQNRGAPPPPREFSCFLVIEVGAGSPPPPCFGGGCKPCPYVSTCPIPPD